MKLPINADLSCPNRDGTLAFSGCIFCSEEGSASPTTKNIISITDQMLNAKNSFRRSSHNPLYIPYFQAYTNTYGDIVLLKKLYDEAVAFPDIVGLMIGTRPDCIDREICSLVKSYDRDNFELCLEIGFQTCHDKSLKFLKRGHSNDNSLDSIKLAAEYEIPVCLHVILGIPGETWSDMMTTADMISDLPVNGVKIHHMHVIKGTHLEKIYYQEQLNLLSLNEYVSTVCDFIERLRTDILIHRLTGDRSPDTLIHPRWGIHKGTVLRSIEDEFRKRTTSQGFLCDNGF